MILGNWESIRLEEGGCEEDFGDGFGSYGYGTGISGGGSAIGSYGIAVKLGSGRGSGDHFCYGDQAYPEGEEGDGEGRKI